MLTFDQLDVLSEPITDLYERFAQSVINDMARRISKLPMTATAAWQMQRLAESGRVYEKVLDEMESLTGRSNAELKKAFFEAGVKTMRFDDAIYRAAGLNPLPLNLSPAMLDVLKIGLNRTAGLFRNLTSTTALTSQQAFLDAADLAYMQVSSGAMSYGQAMKDAVSSIADTGLKVIAYPSGRHDQLDVAVRRSLLTGVGQLAGDLQFERAKEMGVDLVQTSAHIGARPTHEVWQGRIFSLSGASEKYPDFVTETGFGTITGLHGINCRHSFYPFFEGISADAYKDLEAYEGKPVNYNGGKMPFYDATQKQREFERKIRKAKRKANALSAAGIDNTEEILEVKNLQAHIRDFVAQTGLDRQGVREGGKVLKISTYPVLRPITLTKMRQELEDFYNKSNELVSKGLIGRDKVLSEIEKFISNRQREYLFNVEKDGYIRSYGLGNENSASVDKSFRYINPADYAGMTDIHNHPNTDGPFSLQDIISSDAWGMAESRVVTKNFVYTITPKNPINTRWVPNIKKFAIAFKEEKYQAAARFFAENNKNSTNITPEDFSVIIQNMWDKLIKRFNFNLTRRKL